MSYHGDIRLGDTIDIKFTTTAATTGAPTTLSGTPVISAYVGNSTTQITAGITLTVDFDTVTGFNNVRVVASSGNGFSTASNVQLVITTGTVGGTSAVGYVIGEFSIENRSALMPTTATRTLDVSATGEAGIDWANVGSPTTTVNLSGTTTNLVNTATATTTVNGLAANVITATSIAANAITDAKVASDVTIASVTGSVGSVTGAVGSVTGNVGGNVTGSVGTVNALAANVITAAATAADFTTEIQAGLATSSALSTLQTSVNTIDDFLDTEVASILSAVDTEVAAIKNKTDQLNFTKANELDTNVQSINGVTINGDGAGTPMGV